MSETSQQLELIINMLKAQSASIEECKANLAEAEAQADLARRRLGDLAG